MKCVALSLLLSLLAFQQPATPERAIIDKLDRSLQERFTRTDNGFGLSRIAPQVGPHGELFLPKNSPLLKTEAGEPAVAVAFYHLKPPAKNLAKSFEKYYQEVRYVGGESALLELSSPMLARADLTSALTPLAAKHRAELVQGQSIELLRHGKVISFRPIPAQRACLACHKSAKIGEGLAALVYVAQKK